MKPHSLTTATVSDLAIGDTLLVPDFELGSHRHVTVEQISAKAGQVSVVATDKGGISLHPDSVVIKVIFDA